LAALFDPGTLELLSFPAGSGSPREPESGALAGTGLIRGTSAVAFASDPRVQGGALGTSGCLAITGAYREAVTRGVPIIGLWHSGGARLAEARRACTRSAPSSP
jgi:acetyl-CoA/propionyl-CoA carboxylase carboxyl transferase subunit